MIKMTREEAERRRTAARDSRIKNGTYNPRIDLLLSAEERAELLNEEQERREAERKRREEEEKRVEEVREEIRREAYPFSSPQAKARVTGTGEGAKLQKPAGYGELSAAIQETLMTTPKKETKSSDYSGVKAEIAPNKHYAPPYTPAALVRPDTYDQWTTYVKARNAEGYDWDKQDEYNFDKLDKHYGVATASDFDKYVKKGRKSGGSDNLVELYSPSDDDLKGLAKARIMSVNPSNQEDIDRIRQMTGLEKDIYNYYYGKYGKKEANAYLDDMETALNARVAGEETEEYAEFAKEHPYLAGVVSVGEGLQGGGAAVETVAQTLSGDKDFIDYNAPGFSPARRQAAIQSGAASRMSDFGGKMYGLGTSIANSTANAVLGPVGLFNMAASAAGSSMYDTAQRTDNKTKVVVTGLLHGVAEYAGEKLGGIGALEGSLDDIGRALATEGGAKNVVKYIMAHSNEEGLEEAATEVANMAVDFFVMGDEGEMRQYFDRMKAEGKNPWMMTAAMAMGRVLEAYGGGAITGGVMAGVPAAGMRMRTGGRMDINYNGLNDSLGRTESAFHTPEMLRVIDEYNDAVDDGLLDFVNYAKENKSDNKSSYAMSEVSERAAADVKRLTGIDVAGFEHSVKTNTIKHIEKDHGSNGTTDHSMSDPKDIARMDYVLNNYDSVELLPERSKEFRDKNKTPAPMVRFMKRIDGTYYVVEAVPDTKARKLQIVSAYKNKAAQQVRDAQGPDAHVRNEPADTALRSATASTDNADGSTAAPVDAQDVVADNASISGAVGADNADGNTVPPADVQNVPADASISGAAVTDNADGYTVPPVNAQDVAADASTTNIPQTEAVVKGENEGEFDGLVTLEDHAEALKERVFPGEDSEKLSGIIENLAKGTDEQLGRPSNRAEEIMFALARHYRDSARAANEPNTDLDGEKLDRWINVNKVDKKMRKN